MIHITDSQFIPTSTTIDGRILTLDYASVINCVIYWQTDPGYPCMRATLQHGISTDGLTFTPDTDLDEPVYVQTAEFESQWDGQGMADVPSGIQPDEVSHYWVEAGLIAHGQFGVGAVLITEKASQNLPPTPFSAQAVPASPVIPVKMAVPALPSQIPPAVIEVPTSLATTFTLPNGQVWNMITTPVPPAFVGAVHVGVAAQENATNLKWPVGAVFTLPVVISGPTATNVQYQRMS